MRHRTLEREQLARNLGRDRELRACRGSLETEVVVAMADLGCSAGLHDVDLAGDAVCGAEPGFTDDC
jgi:hypothetical protein